MVAQAWWIWSPDKGTSEISGHCGICCQGRAEENDRQARAGFPVFEKRGGENPKKSSGALWVAMGDTHCCAGRHRRSLKAGQRRSHCHPREATAMGNRERGSVPPPTLLGAPTPAVSDPKRRVGRSIRKQTLTLLPKLGCWNRMRKNRTITSTCLRATTHRLGLLCSWASTSWR